MSYKHTVWGVVVAGSLLVGVAAEAAITSPLSVGSRGMQVQELQQRLSDLGFYHGPITGYFGPLTRTAVITFQQENSISPATGYFGALSRAALGKSAQAPAGVSASQNKPPQVAIDACSGKASGDTCSFSDKSGELQGTCNTKPGLLACSPGKAAVHSNTATTTTKNAGNAGSFVYSVAQAISDTAQLDTMAFDGLGFLTGTTCSDSFLPPGKVADYFGFQYLRDATQSGKGHSTDFVTNAANNVLHILNDAQKQKLLALAKAQETAVNDFAYMRFPLMTAFRRSLGGDIPVGTTGLSKKAVMDYSSDLFALDAQVSIDRATLYASIIASLDTTQKASLDTMKKGGFASWAALPDQLDKSSMTHDENVLVMTYAGDIFSWYAGDNEADTYFCPERHADYFGGFYIKDAPAMGNPGYTIDESITGTQGAAFLSALDTTQRTIVTGVIDSQRSDITNIVTVRRAISTELRKALSGTSLDATKIIALSRQYGALDGEISYYYANAFTRVGKTLTTTQKQALQKLRGLSEYSCPDTSAYLYSEKIHMPSQKSTDSFFQ